MISRMLHSKENNSNGSNSYEISISKSNDATQLTSLNGGDERLMDAADTLVSLAHSASSTPTIESNPFYQTEPINNESNGKLENDPKLIEKTIQLEQLINVKDQVEKASTGKNKDEAVETACKALLKQLLETCPNLNLASITIRATAVPATEASSENLKNSVDNNKSINSLLVNDSLTDNMHLLSDQHEAKELVKNLEKALNKTTSFSNANKKQKLKHQTSQESNSKERKSTKRSFSSITKNNDNLMCTKQNGSNDSKYNVIDDDDDDDDDDDSNDMRTAKKINMRTAPTLATGRRSKDTQLPPNEERKRQERRERNKEAAARCRRKREDLTANLLRQTQELNLEREKLKKLNNDLINEKQRLEGFLSTHENVCVHSKVKGSKINNNFNHIQHVQSQSQQPTILLKLKKEDLSDFIMKQSQEKNTNGKVSVKTLIPQTTDELKALNQQFQLNASTLLTPTSGNQLETFLSQFELPNKQQQQQTNSLNSSTNTSSDSSSSSSSSLCSPSYLQRPNNLNFKSTRSNQSAQSSNQQLLTPYAFIQNFALALNSAVNGQQAAVAAASAAMSNTTPSFNNNFSLLMTPTLQLNTPSAFFALTPLESTLIESLNTPIIQNNSILGANLINNSHNKNNINNSGDSSNHIPIQSNSSTTAVASSLIESNKVK